jgi:hypothetical protein
MSLHTNENGKRHYIATAFVKCETHVEKLNELDDSSPMGLLPRCAWPALGLW